MIHLRGKGVVDVLGREKKRSLRERKRPQLITNFAWRPPDGCTLLPEHRLARVGPRAGSANESREQSLRFSLRRWTMRRRSVALHCSFFLEEQCCKTCSRSCALVPVSNAACRCRGCFRRRLITYAGCGRKTKTKKARRTSAKTAYHESMRKPAADDKTQ